MAAYIAGDDASILRCAELLVALAGVEQPLVRTGAEGLLGPERVLGRHHGGDALGAGDGDAQLDQPGVGAQPAVRGVHEHEAVEPIAAPRGSPSARPCRPSSGRAPTQRSQPRASSSPSRSAAKASKRVRRLVVGLAARAVAALVGGDGVPAQLGQRVEAVGEVLLGAGEAVDAGAAAARRRRPRPPPGETGPPCPATSTVRSITTPGPKPVAEAPEPVGEGRAPRPATGPRCRPARRSRRARSSS